jgi:hypothetical protein
MEKTRGISRGRLARKVSLVVFLVVSMLVPGRALAAVPITEWKGEYFANPDLQGTPKLVRNDVKVNFDWGTGAPASGLPADNFGVRWTRNLQFKAGTYRFCVTADDGVRVEMDDQRPFIREWHDGLGTYCKEMYVTAGRHKVRVEYYEHLGLARAQFWLEKVSSYPDWKGEYYSNTKLSGSPALTRNDPNIDFNWGAGAPAAGLPADNFSVRWTRKRDFAAGNYRFTVQVDDGVRFWVDGKILIDQWHDGVATYRADTYLAEGQHDLRLEMYERRGGAMARLWWGPQTNEADWKGKYFNNAQLAGKPVLVRTDRTIDFAWGSGAPAAGLPADNFSVQWTAHVDFAPGTYRFCVKADDGARVEMDDQRPFIRQWRDGSGTNCADVVVTGGSHKVRVEYYEHLGGALVQFWWRKL